AVPLLRVGRGQRDVDLLAVLGAGEVEVLHHLFFGQAKVFRHARVTQVLERMAAGAVVHVQRGTALQGGAVRQVVAGLLHGAAGSGECGGGEQEPGGRCGQQGNPLLSHASSPVPAPAWSCRSWSRSAWSGRTGSSRRSGTGRRWSRPGRYPGRRRSCPATRS